MKIEFIWEIHCFQVDLICSLTGHDTWYCSTKSVESGKSWLLHYFSHFQTLINPGLLQLVTTTSPRLWNYSFSHKLWVVLLHFPINLEEAWIMAARHSRPLIHSAGVFRLNISLIVVFRVCFWGICKRSPIGQSLVLKLLLLFCACHWLLIWLLCVVTDKVYRVPIDCIVCLRWLL